MNTQRKLVIVACLLLVALPIVVATPLAAADPTVHQAGKCVDLRPDNPLDPVAVYDCPTTAQP